MTESTNAIKSSIHLGEEKDYGINWADVLGDESVASIASSTWSVSDPAGLTVMASPAPSIVGLLTVVWLKADPASAVRGTNYTLTNTIVTAGPEPRKHVGTIVVPCS